MPVPFAAFAVCLRFAVEGGTYIYGELWGRYPAGPHVPPDEAPFPKASDGITPSKEVSAKAHGLQYGRSRLSPCTPRGVAANEDRRRKRCGLPRGACTPKRALRREWHKCSAHSEYQAAPITGGKNFNVHLARRKRATFSVATRPRVPWNN